MATLQYGLGTTPTIPAADKPPLFPYNGLTLPPERTVIVYNTNAAYASLIPARDYYNTLRLDGKAKLYGWDFGSNAGSVYNPTAGINDTTAFEAFWDDFLEPFGAFCAENEIQRILLFSGAPNKLSIARLDNPSARVTELSTYILRHAKELYVAGATAVAGTQVMTPDFNYYIGQEGPYFSARLVSYSNNPVIGRYPGNRYGRTLSWSSATDVFLTGAMYLPGEDPFPHNLMAAGYVGTRPVETLTAEGLIALFDRAVACELDIISNGYRESHHNVTMNLCSRLSTFGQAWHIAILGEFLQACGLPLGPYVSDASHIYSAPGGLDPITRYPIGGAAVTVSGGQATRVPSSFPGIPTWVYMGAAVQNTPNTAQDWTGVYDFLPGAWGFDTTSNGEAWSRYLYAQGGVGCFMSGSLEPTTGGRMHYPIVVALLTQGHTLLDAEFLSYGSGDLSEVTGDPLFRPFPRSPEFSTLRSTSNVGADERAKSFRFRSAY